MGPADLAIGETLGFVTSHLARRRSRILEVGCGDGALARRLVAAGHEVVGIDRSAKAVAQSRAAGFEATLGDFVEWGGDSGPFETVVFTRSLHHIHELEAAVERARGLLVPGGVFLAEEFALERMNERTASWLRDLRSILAAAGLVRAPRASASALAAWREAHAHEPPLHEGRAMVAAVRRRFRFVRVERVPYLYRYFGEELEATQRGDAVARTILETEARLVSEGALVPIGLRVFGERTKR